MQMDQSELGRLPLIWRDRVCVREKRNFHNDIWNAGPACLEILRQEHSVLTETSDKGELKSLFTFSCDVKIISKLIIIVTSVCVT